MGCINGGGGCRISGLVLLICAAVMLLSAAATATANGIRATGMMIDGTRGPSVPGRPAAAAATTAAAEHGASDVAAGATTAAAQVASDGDPYKGSERKVPNGPDPIHNRRARWGDAPARRV